MRGFRYDEPSRRGFLEGRRITSITEALNGVGLFPPPPGGCAANFAYAGERGTAVHSMCEIDDLGKCSDFEFDPNLQGYLDAWRSFKLDYAFSPEIVEERMFHPIFQFHGKPDAAGPVYQSTPGELYAVVERKTCELKDRFGFQLALQEELILNRLGGKPGGFLALAVQLKPDGGYRAERFDTRKYRALALGAVAIQNYKLNAGLV